MPHISAQHLDYFPFGCTFCKKANLKFLATTEADMNQHISTHHNGNNLGIVLLKDQIREAELNRMIEECHQLPIQQIPSTDSKIELHRALNLHNTSATTIRTGYAVLNGSGLSQVSDENGTDNDEPYNFIESHVKMDLPNQSTLNRKRRLFDNVSNDSLESRENRRHVMNVEQLASDGLSSREDNHGNANSSNQSAEPALMNATVSQRKDRIECPTTSSQVTSSVPADSSQKQIITKLFIVISEAIVCFETIGPHTYEYAPLRDYLEILRESVLSTNGCEVVIQFYACDTGIPFKYRKTSEQSKQEFTSLEQLKTFAQHLHSIAFLWAGDTVTAHFGPFKKKRNKMPSQLDYCSDYSAEALFFKCKKLASPSSKKRPLFIVTNVVDRCDECELQLEEMLPGNCELHDAFLEEIYERETIQKMAVTLCICDVETVNDFIDKLKKRFRRAPQKCFKFELFAHSKEVDKLSLKTQDCILRSKTSKNYLESVIIEQRAIGS
ncbi:hypothetical protein Ddc_17347 [Ditylenchus destructor]|nr:hypothetical protein Ddc_17347 [Ditylenchus destructor]